MRNRITGFTLIELLITLAILAVLATLTVPMAQVSIQRTKEQELRRVLWDIRHAIDAYKKASDEGKIPKEIGSSGYPPNLRVLVEGVKNQADPKGKKMVFLRRIPPDPFVSEQEQDPADMWGKRSYESPASDPQEGDDVFDVYSRSKRVGLNGVPYEKW